MMPPSRVVLDTNIFVSAFLLPTSPVGILYEGLVRRQITYASLDLIIEVGSVLCRPKFRRYTRSKLVSDYIHFLLDSLHFVSPIPRFLPVCGDPKDNLILSTAAAAKADLIVTGDADLLVLHPFQGISILSPSQYLSL